MKLTLVLLLQLIFFVHLISSSTDTIYFNESLADDGQVIVSNGETYSLGFFSPGTSSNRYLGIWYTKVSLQTVVWVANREDPINDTSGLLSIDDQGGIVLRHGSRNSAPLWSTNVSAGNNSMARLLGEGNFVLLGQDGKTVMWQSFDHPTDTVFPNMKFGLDRRTGLSQSVKPWKSAEDPAAGDWSYNLDTNGLPQLMLYKGRTKRWRSGPWNGIRWNGIPEMSRNFIFNISMVNNPSETTFAWGIMNRTIISRLYLDPSGVLKRATWNDQDSRWNEFWSVPKEPCDNYGHCGPNGNCDLYGNNAGMFECSCLPGFEPRSQNEWYLRDGSGGCVRKAVDNSTCVNGEGFIRLANAKIPDTWTGKLNLGMDLNMCGEECLKNCSCTAYASSNLTSGVGCVTLYGDLFDTRVFSDGGQDLFVRVGPAEFAEYMKRSKGQTRKKSKKKLLAIAFATVAAAIILGVSIVVWMLKRKRNAGSSEGINHKDSPVPSFGVNDIFAATDNFSLANKLGQGGFGSVYKGRLPDGQEIAVKRLSQTSKQDKSRVSLLDWKTRLDIIVGIARGLLYLHQDSRLKIIHRDLKASNVLLDTAMNAKISDFGMAKLIGEDQSEANTNRIVGTYGYMSPEYAMEGLYSMKSDVFSFGVLTLEIVSGRRSNRCYQESSSPNLIGYVWSLWREGRVLEMVDLSTMGESYSEDQVLKCVQIGLLCVQESPLDRPTMSTIVFMLSNTTILPSPKKPAFILPRVHDDLDSLAAAGSTNSCLKAPREAQYGGGMIANQKWTASAQRLIASNFPGISEDGNLYGLVFNRSNSIDSESQKVQFVKGNLYVFSGWIQVSEGSQAVGVVFRTNRGELIPGGKVTAKTGCWSLLKGGIFANFSGPAEILFESKNTTTADIWIDNVSLQPFTMEEWRSHQDKTISKERKSKVRFQVKFMNGTSMAGAKVTFKQIKPEFPFGCGMNYHILSSKGYQEWFVSRFKYTTFTNEMKWYSNEMTQGQENYATADAMMQFAKEHGISVRGHCIFWDHSMYQQGWVLNLTPDELKAAAAKRIDSVVSRYAGQLIAWDVMNENLHHSFYEDKLGRNITSQYFLRAHQLDPNARLFMNEYNTIEYHGDLAAKPRNYINRLKEILSYPGNQNISAGIGVQGHFVYTKPNLAYMRSSLDMLYSTGIPIWLTEVSTGKGKRQAEFLELVLREVYSHPGVKGIIMFAGPAASRFKETILADYEFKNTATGDVVDKLIHEWGSNNTIVESDEKGLLEVSLFHGDYNITVENTDTANSFNYKVSKDAAGHHVHDVMFP
ncbi:G-type lectin S-receptor-like serine/threonine-protein kinase RKS1 [Linum perenne]